jgi:uncharacterized protein (UPF0335 family)
METQVVKKNDKFADVEKVADPKTALARSNSGADTRLLRFVERVERLDEEAQGIKDDRKEVLDEAKATGFDVKTLRKLLARRKLNATDRMEGDALLELFEAAVTNAEKRERAASQASGT